MAGWYDDAWVKRIPVNVSVTAAAGSPVDVTLTLSADWDEFWGNVMSGGEDVRLCAPDGVTALSYKLLTWTLATRAATIEINGLPVSSYTGLGAADGTVFIWLYWGNSAAVDAQSVFTSSSPVTAGVYLGSGDGEGWVDARPSPGSTNPVDELTKSTTEKVRYWVTMREPDKRADSYAGSLGMWGVSFTQDGVLLAGVSQTTMFSLTADPVVMTETPDGGIKLGYMVSAGSDAAAYTLSEYVVWYMSTSGAYEKQIVNPRAILRVNDLSEA